MDRMIKHEADLNKFLTHSSKSSEWGSKAARIMSSALTAVNPYTAVLNSLNYLDNLPGGIKGLQHLSEYQSIHVVGAGKAGKPMAEAAQEYFRDRISAGIVITKEGYAKSPNLLTKIEIVEAGHPIPDQRGVKATQEIINLLHKSSTDDLVICLFSGGGSALLGNPVAGVSLQEIQKLTELLLASGATINEINTLRKHLDQVKGGQLARIAVPSRVICLILSDVVGDPLDVIASGPTVPDPSTYQDAIDILNRYSIFEHAPTSIRTHLELGRQGKIDETPKIHLENVHNFVVGSNQTASQAAIEQAKKEGFNSFCLTNYLQGEAGQAGKFLGSILRQLAMHDQPIARPACIVVGGETTVTIQGDGMGGRNQELALAAVSELSGLENVALITLATDGGDGPGDAAGAVVTGKTLSRAASLNLDARDYLSDNNSYNFFLPLGDLLKIGPTQTNVNDLTFLFSF